MFSMVQRHDVQVLLRAGVSQDRISQLTQISVRTIRRIGGEVAVESIGPEAPSGRAVGRPSKALRFAEVVSGWLKKEPDVKSVEVLRRMKKDGYEGGRTAAYALIATLRPRVRRFTMRFEGLPGEFTQHDFGEVVVCYADGQRERVTFFASRMKYSRLVQVTLVPNQKAETLIRTMMSHFAAFGGIPLLAVFDRPKTIALKWRKDGTVIEWNPTFAQAVVELGLGVELCWAYRPQQKGSVENLVGWVKGSFFSQRRFADYADLLAQLAEWLLEVNTIRPCRATGVTPAQRFEEERHRLRPLPVAPENFALRFEAGVGPTAEVSFEGAIYSVHPDAVGLPAQIRVYPERIVIAAGRFTAEHPRLAAGERSVLPEHRAACVAAVSGRRGRRYLKRQQLLELGAEVYDYLSEIVHRRPAVWSRDVDIMYQLLEVVGDHALRRGIVSAARAKLYGGEYVARFVEAPVDLPEDFLE
jgi:transposase